MSEVIQNYFKELTKSFNEVLKPERDSIIQDFPQGPEEVKVTVDNKVIVKLPIIKIDLRGLSNPKKIQKYSVFKCQQMAAISAMQTMQNCLDHPEILHSSVNIMPTYNHKQTETDFLETYYVHPEFVRPVFLKNSEITGINNIYPVRFQLIEVQNESTQTFGRSWRSFIPDKIDYQFVFDLTEDAPTTANTGESLEELAEEQQGEDEVTDTGPTDPFKSLPLPVINSNINTNLN